MFPIRDGKGQLAGFGARALNPEDVPKYLNSPQTALFDKGKLLYGLHAARKAIRSEGQIVIVEGYMDVIALHQQGFPNAYPHGDSPYRAPVAGHKTAVQEDHFGFGC